MLKRQQPQLIKGTPSAGLKGLQGIRFGFDGATTIRAPHLFGGEGTPGGVEHTMAPRQNPASLAPLPQTNAAASTEPKPAHLVGITIPHQRSDGLTTAALFHQQRLHRHINRPRISQPIGQCSNLLRGGVINPGFLNDQRLPAGTCNRIHRRGVEHQAHQVGAIQLAMAEADADFFGHQNIRGHKAIRQHRHQGQTRGRHQFPRGQVTTL